MDDLQRHLDAESLDVADALLVDETPFGAEAGETSEEQVAPPPIAHHPASGVAYALAAYVWWGFVVPIYIFWFRSVDSLEILAIRVLTGLPFLIVLIVWSGQTRELRAALTTWKTYRYLTITTALIGFNWFAFIYVISHHGLELQASLGYYITPLISVALGMIVLGERLRPLQWAALALGVVGVAALAFVGQAPTWALVMALSFGSYGLLRKRAHVSPLVGIAVEMANLSIPTGILLLYRWLGPGVTFADLPLLKGALLACAGAITIAPLLWFTHAARRLRLSTLGFIQFIAPTGQFILAVAIMGETFHGVRVLTFCLIWLAIALFMADSIRHHRRRPAPKEPRA